MSAWPQRSHPPSPRTFARSPRNPSPWTILTACVGCPGGPFSRLRRDFTRWPGRPVVLLVGRVRGSTPRGGAAVSEPLCSAAVATTSSLCQRRPPRVGEQPPAPRAMHIAPPSCPRVPPARARSPPAFHHFSSSPARLAGRCARRSDEIWQRSRCAPPARPQSRSRSPCTRPPRRLRWRPAHASCWGRPRTRCARPRRAHAPPLACARRPFFAHGAAPRRSRRTTPPRRRRTTPPRRRPRYCLTPAPPAPHSPPPPLPSLTPPFPPISIPTTPWPPIPPHPSAPLVTPTLSTPHNPPRGRTVALVCFSSFFVLDIT